MVLPFLEIVINPQAPTSGAKYLAPLLGPFPKNLHLLLICVIMLVLFIIHSLFAVLRSYYSIRILRDLQQYWSCGIMENYMYSEFASLLRQKQGVLLNNIINEPSFASKSLRDLIEFMAKIMISLFILMFLFMVNWRISLILCFIAAVMLLIVWRISYNYSFDAGKKKIKLNQQISGVAAESIAGIRQVKTFSMENRVLKEFSGKLDRLQNILVKFQMISTLPKVLGQLIISAIIIGTLLFYQYVIALPLASIIPLLGLFMGGAQKLYGNLSLLFSERMSIISYIPSFKLVHELVNNKAIREATNGGKPIKSLKQGIRFRDVSFSYENGKPLFDRLNMDLLKGSITAIVGVSGSGKSSLCDLLIGFYRPDGGKILVDNENLQELNIHKWRGFIGYISQDSFLFNTSVRENILIGKSDASEEEIMRAAQLADAHEFIEGLPAKYNTIIGDSGVTLSGGQRQRIAIARAFVRNPELLILDEATSSLDSESEQRIHESIKKLSQTKAILIITHRLPSLRIADQIYVLENGKVVESGQYEELIEKKGMFWRLEQLSRKSETQSVEIN
jgi:ABC-type multidrug transport system fused ATPase/permease subunit